MQLIAITKKRLPEKSAIKQYETVTLSHRTRRPSANARTVLCPTWHRKSGNGRNGKHAVRTSGAGLKPFGRINRNLPGAGSVEPEIRSKELKPRLGFSGIQFAEHVTDGGSLKVFLRTNFFPSPPGRDKRSKDSARET